MLRSREPSTSARIASAFVAAYALSLLKRGRVSRPGTWPEWRPTIARELHALSRTDILVVPTRLGRDEQAKAAGRPRPPVPSAGGSRTCLHIAVPVNPMTWVAFVAAPERRTCSSARPAKAPPRLRLRGLEPGGDGRTTSCGPQVSSAAGPIAALVYQSGPSMGPSHDHAHRRAPGVGAHHRRRCRDGRGLGRTRGDGARLDNADHHRRINQTTTSQTSSRTRWSG